MKSFLAGVGIATTLFTCGAWVFKLHSPEKAEQVINILTTSPVSDSLVLDTLENTNTLDTVIVETGISEEEFCSALGCFVKKNNVFKPDGKEYIILQNYIADVFEMPLITKHNLDSAKKAGYLVKLVETKFLAFKKKELKSENEWGTPEMKNVLDSLSAAFYKKFHKKLQLSSALRTVEYQKQLVKKNSNATTQKSLHSRGCTFDISYRDGKNKSKNFNLTEVEKKWVENWFKKAVITNPNIWVTKEEIGSWCYHIVVFSNQNRPRTPV